MAEVTNVPATKPDSVRAAGTGSICQKAEEDCYGYTAVPEQPGLRCRIWFLDAVCAPTPDERVQLRYRGSREQILSLGIIDAHVLAPWKRGQPRGKVDLDGDPISISKNWVCSEGEQPTLRYCLDLKSKSRGSIEQLPGVALLFENMRAQAIADEEEDRRDLEARRASQVRTGECEGASGPNSGNVIPFRPRAR